ncbi:MAG: hypothetical protein C0478_16335 [Planctomyces sp.]|jgi:hypothetical protein|nr:hypothetical protein [Planctomyces sp.]
MLLAEIVPTWYLLPLAMVISLVYSASRYELPDVILKRAFRLCMTILIAMSIAFAVLWGLSYGL